MFGSIIRMHLNNPKTLQKYHAVSSSGFGAKAITLWRQMKGETMRLPDIDSTASVRMAGWSHTAEFCREKIGRGEMLHLLAETTNRCDQDCEYCYTVLQTLDSPQFHLQALPGELVWQERKRLIDEAASLGAVTYDIVGAGEPLIDPLFLRQVEYAASKGMVPVVFTNGSILGMQKMGDRFARKLWEIGASVVVKRSLPQAMIVTDRFHVQQLVSDAVQEMRITLRRDALKEENEAIKKARADGKQYVPFTYENGDTKKQLLARSRYLLFKLQSAWHDQQKARAAILCRAYPQLKVAYDLSMMFRSCYEHSRSIPEAREQLQAWYRKIEEKKMDAFLTAAESIRLHEATILNYFVDRSTNASAESFNAKLKNFRAVVRGVSDKSFHLFRVSKLYA